MKTSYFANLGNVKVPLSISQYAPKWYVGPQLKLLAPPPELLRRHGNGLSNEEYKAEYHRLVLNNLDAREVYDAIVAEYTDAVTLLCFEKAGDFCHRRLVAEWFEEKLGVEVPEWEKPVARTSLIF